MSPLQANLLLLLAGATWGMGFVAQSTAMDDVGPFLFVALRFLVATLVVLPFALREWRQSKKIPGPAPVVGDVAVPSQRPLSACDYRHFGLIGLALFAGMATQQIGLLTTSVTNSGFLTGLYVVFTPALAVLLYRARPHRIIWPAAFTALAGIFLLSGGDLSLLVAGDLLTIVSAGFWALQVVLIGRFVIETGRPLMLSAVQFAVTTLLAGLLAVLLEPIVWSDIQRALPEILYAGVVASGLAFTLQVIGQRYTSAPQAAIFLSSEAPFAAFFGFLFLDERLTSIGLVGCALILLAMLLVELVPMIAKRQSVN